MEQFLESIQPARQFGAVLTGILPSKGAKTKEVFIRFRGPLGPGSQGSHTTGFTGLNKLCLWRKSAEALSSQHSAPDCATAQSKKDQKLLQKLH
jgi:hypothetical protein